MNRKGRTVTFLTAVTDVGQLLKENWLQEFRGSISFPLYEGAVFSFGKGRAWLYLQNAAGERLYVRDATCKYAWWESTVVFRLLKRDRGLWYACIPWLEAASGGKLEGFGPELLPAVARFPGFSRDFYDAIPYGQDECIPVSFRWAAKQLRTPRGAKEFYLHSGLPQCKTIRKLFFQSPQLMFYMPEHKIIWRLLGDVNRYRSFLEGQCLYDVLATLHQRPAIEGFFRDYACVCGPKTLDEKLCREWSGLRTAAIDYCSMSRESRMLEQKRWPGKKFQWLYRERMPAFSIPMAKAAEGVLDEYTVDGFTFRRLRTNREYARAGREMQNCLGSWGTSDNPVFCIHSRLGKPVGAVEIRDKTVVQVRAFDNQSIFIYPGLFEAYRQWMDAENLVEEFGLELRDFDDELPF